MVVEPDLKNNDMRDKVAVYITLNGLPLFRLPLNHADDRYIMISSFLHTIDLFARETRKNVGRSAHFFGFSLVNKVEVDVMEIENKDTEDQIRLFLEKPYGKVPINRAPIAALLDATRTIMSKIKNKEINPIMQDDIINYFIKRLIERGYTPDKMLSELEKLKLSRVQSSKLMPISLYSIEQKEESGEGFNLKEIGKYNVGKFKGNRVKDEEGKLTFDSGLIIGLAEALKSYQSMANMEVGVINLRFRDYSLAISYNKQGLPIIGILAEGKGNIQEFSRYRRDLRKLEI